jgi:hypothetical protein
MERFNQLIAQAQSAPPEVAKKALSEALMLLEREVRGHDNSYHGSLWSQFCLASRQLNDSGNHVQEGASVVRLVN